MSDSNIIELDKLEVIYNANKNTSDLMSDTAIKQFDDNGLITNEFMLFCLSKAGGNISKAATIAGCSRRLYYKRAIEVEGFKELVDDIRETKIDIAEDKLWEHIEMGNPHAIMFYLKTIGKRRGYTTVNELNLNADAEIKINVNFGKFDEEELTIIYSDYR